MLQKESLKELLLKSPPEYYSELINSVFGNASQLKYTGYMAECLPCPFNGDSNICIFYRLFNENELGSLGVDILNSSCKRFSESGCNYNQQEHAENLLEERARLKDLEIKRLERNERRKYRKNIEAERASTEKK